MFKGACTHYKKKIPKYTSAVKKYYMEKGYYNPKIRVMIKMVHTEQSCDHLRGPHPGGCQSLVLLGGDRRIVLL